MEDLKLIVLKSAYPLGYKVNKALKELNKAKKSYLVDITESRFQMVKGN